MNLNSILLLFRNRALLLTGIVLWALTSSCEELPEPLFSNSVIHGNIDFYYNNDEALEDISITARGPYEKKMALTDSNGDYEITGLGNGTYNLEISKEGYGTKYQYGIQLFGNDTVRVRDELYKRMTGLKLPTLYEIHTQDTYSWLSEKKIVISTSRSQGEIPCRVFMSEDDDVSYNNFQWTSKAHSVKRNGFDKLLLFVEFIPFEPGKKVFLRVYICNPNEYYGYFNKYTGMLTFSTLEKDERSSVMSFRMPSP
jgi:hypothetical protein